MNELDSIHAEIRASTGASKKYLAALHDRARILREQGMKSTQPPSCTCGVPVQFDGQLCDSCYRITWGTKR